MNQIEYGFKFEFEIKSNQIFEYQIKFRNPSDVSINMSGEEIEDYNTDMGACFGKVYVYLIKLCIDN